MTGGTSYKFRVKAINKYGDGAYATTPTGIVAGQAPDAPSAPTLTLTTMYVKIAWTEPTTNNLAIDKY